MKAGDKIRIKRWTGQCEDFTVEEFRYCLGIFESDEHRLAGRFTPLCELYEPGPDSEQGYIPNFGEYTTNHVPAFMNLPN